MITGNGEDGMEIIDSPVAGATTNRLRIARNTIRENARYGIGGVEQTAEERNEGLLSRGVLLRTNVVEGNGKDQVAGAFWR